MIRYLIAIICIGIFLIVTLPYLGLEWILGKFNRKASDLRQLHIVQWMFKYLLWVSGTKVIVIGEENVPKDEAVLYIGNHKSLSISLLLMHAALDLQATSLRII